MKTFYILFFIFSSSICFGQTNSSYKAPKIPYDSLCYCGTIWHTESDELEIYGDTMKVVRLFLHNLEEAYGQLEFIKNELHKLSPKKTLVDSKDKYWGSNEPILINTQGDSSYIEVHLR